MLVGANVGVAIWITGSDEGKTNQHLMKGRHVLIESNLAYVHPLGLDDLV